ncbi:hybrid sensor histidine kinase/response regulator [Lysinibacillus sp. LZ02]|uniref:hybrid sensor histidine kinase/response regulator n=1 Tax=Lysinibacillus sp. LZ02 TaxID=3420668 RepID=UPI003D3629CB
MSKKIFYTLITVSVIFLTIGMFTSHNIKMATVVDKGKFSLSKENVENDEVVQLDGTWAFYPNILISPDEQLTKYEANRVDVAVPHDNWPDYVKANEEGIEVGTYAIEVEVPTDGEYALYIQRIRQVNEVFINGKSNGLKGNPSKIVSYLNAENDEKYVVVGHSENQTLHIMIRVTNGLFESAGITNSVQFGTKKAVQSEYRAKILVEVFTLVACVVMGLIYIVSYWQNRKRLEELYFGLFILFFGAYISLLGQKLFFYVFPYLDYIWQKNFQLLFASIMSVCFTYFIEQIYPEKLSKNMRRMIIGLVILQCAIFYILFIYTKGNIEYSLLKRVEHVLTFTTMIVLIYNLTILIRMVVSRVKESTYIVMVFIAFLLYYGTILFTYLTNIQIDYLRLFQFLFLLGSFSALLSYRANAAYERAEALSKELLIHNEMKDEFLIKTSHELRTPLNGILNISKTLMEGVQGPLKREQQENVMLIHNISQRMTHLVDELLYSSSYVTGELGVSKRAVCVEIVKDVMEEVRYVIPRSKRLELRCELKDNLPPMYTDELRLKQVLYNLLTNAVKYSTYGEIVVKGTKIGEVIQLQVIDQGIGISAQDLTHIFDSFYRAKQTQGAEGLGLGLSITKNIVETLNGTISVESKVGIGSVFTVTMPIATDEQIEGVLEREKIIEGFMLPLPFKQLGVGKTILVVDDSHVNLKVLIDMLGKQDYSIIAVDNGEDALDYVKNEKIDIMVVDLMMRGMSGYELCKEVRKLYDVLELPIIVLTAVTKHTDLLMSLQVGANDYMQKPIVMDELNIRLESLVAMKHSAQEAVEAEMNYLYAQITPHFIYNTLNTIIALSYTDASKMREALECLSTYFRAKLSVHYRHSYVPIENEIELVKAYLYIEQLRFGHRLEVAYDIDEEIELQLPALTIQPIVENAVFHGISKRKEGGTVKITVKRDGDFITIIVADNGVGIPQATQKTLLTEGGTRIGFANPLKKIRLIKNASFQLKSEEGKGTVVKILIPT